MNENIENNPLNKERREAPQTKAPLQKESGELHHPGGHSSSENSQPVDQDLVRRVEEEKKILTQKLTEALNENKTLHERLAEIDINLNIETTELKREIENITCERDDLLKENEGLLSDLSTKDLKIEELRRTWQIEQLMLKEANRYLSVASERMKEWENLKPQLETIKGEKAALAEEKDKREEEIQTLSKGIEDLKTSLDEKSKENFSLKESLSDLNSILSKKDEEFACLMRTELEKVLTTKDEEIERLKELHESALKALSDEREGILSKKDGEIESLSVDINILKEQNDQLSREKSELEREIVESRISAKSIEDILLEKGNFIKELEDRFSRVSELEYEGKEEFSAKLKEAHKEISSLNESRQSLLEALTQREKEREILKVEMEDALAKRDDEIKTLQRDYDEKIRRLDDEKIDTVNAKTLSLENILSEKNNAMREMEEKLKEANEKSVSLEDSIREKDHALSEVGEKLKDASERLILFEDALSAREKLITELNERLEWQKNDIETLKSEKAEQLKETESLEKAYKVLSEKIGNIEETLVKEKTLRSELESDHNLKSMKLEEVEALYESETKRFGAEKEKFETESVRLLDKIGRIEGESSQKERKIIELEEKLSEFQRDIERKESEKEKLTGDIGRLDENLKRLLETSTREKEAIENALSCKEQDANLYAQKAEQLEVELSEAKQKIIRLEEVLSAKESILIEKHRILQEYENLNENLNEEKEILAGKLTEAVKEADSLRHVKIISAEIKGLEEELKKIKEESETSRLMFKSDIAEAFSRISESAGKLENTISEGMHLAKKLEEISANAPKENLPAILEKPSSDLSIGFKKHFKKAVFVLFFILLLLGGISSIFLLKENIYNALKLTPPEKKTATHTATVQSWADGIKQIRNGKYAVTLIFLNREAVGVLGLSVKIPDTSIAENHFALLEIKAESGCIPEDFISSWEKNVSFIDEHDNPLPLILPGPLADEIRVIFKENACDEKSGIVYVKNIISIARDLSIKGLAIRGLNKESPIILR